MTFHIYDEIRYGDYVGIAGELRKAMKDYTRQDRKLLLKKINNRIN
jgi:hypothetical protein